MTQELTWEFFAKNELSVKHKTIFHVYDTYITSGNFKHDEILNIVGAKYFMHTEICLDEIMKLVNDMFIDNHANGLTDYYSFLIFLFKKQLFNKNVTREKADLLFNKYIAVVKPFINKYGRTIDNEFVSTPTDFIMKLTTSKGNTDHEELIHSTLLEYFKELKF